MDLLEKIDMYTWDGEYTNPVNEESAYQKFFAKKLEATGKSLDDMSDDEKKKFFNMVDKEWKADDEKKTNEDRKEEDEDESKEHEDSESEEEEKKEHEEE